ncbi:MAG: amidohydrolase family protein, partial [Clostridia bacterium]|nr:amidohydrolase family protein [Clostridia bacterium]
SGPVVMSAGKIDFVANTPWLLGKGSLQIDRGLIAIGKLRDNFEFAPSEGSKITVNGPSAIRLDAAGADLKIGAPGATSSPLEFGENGVLAFCLAAEGEKYITLTNDVITVNGGLPSGLPVFAYYQYKTSDATFFRKYDRKTIEESIVCTKEAIKNGKAAKIIAGFYMEGPYLSSEFGSTAQNDPWRGEIKEEDYSNIVNLVGDLGRVWAVAPERDGIEGFMKYAKSVNPNTLFAVGHSMATPSQIIKLKKYGIKIQTHCMDATQRVSEWAGTRGAGPDEYCMTEPDMYAELISDSMAIHVNPTLQRLILRTKGIEKVILISDSTISNGPPPEGLKHITDLNFGPTSGLSGSKLTLNVACKNIMAYTNCGIAQAFMMASGNPARALGLDDEIGTLDVGKKANIVFVDDEFNVHKVMFEGELVKE